MKVFSRINKWLLVSLFVVLMLACIAFDGRTTLQGQVLLSVWIMVALPLVFRVIEWYGTRYPALSDKMSRMSGCTYFVFAFHGVIISYVYTVLWKLFGVVSDGSLLDSTYMNTHALNGIAAYLLTPIITVCISVIAYEVVSRVLKKSSWILTGK